MGKYRRLHHDFLRVCGSSMRWPACHRWWVCRFCALIKKWAKNVCCCTFLRNGWLLSMTNCYRCLQCTDPRATSSSSCVHMEETAYHDIMTVRETRQLWHGWLAIASKHLYVNDRRHLLLQVIWHRMTNPKQDRCAGVCRDFAHSFQALYYFI